jgi:hypothetical protein
MIGISYTVCPTNYFSNIKRGSKCDTFKNQYKDFRNKASIIANLTLTRAVHSSDQEAAAKQACLAAASYKRVYFTRAPSMQIDSFGPT